jgi:hypothetical protein
MASRPKSDFFQLAFKLVAKELVKDDTNIYISLNLTNLSKAPLPSDTMIQELTSNIFEDGAMVELVFECSLSKLAVSNSTTIKLIIAKKRIVKDMTRVKLAVTSSFIDPNNIENEFQVNIKKKKDGYKIELKRFKTKTPSVTPKGKSQDSSGFARGIKKVKDIVLKQKPAEMPWPSSQEVYNLKPEGTSSYRGGRPKDSGVLEVDIDRCMMKEKEAVYTGKKPHIGLVDKIFGGLCNSPFGNEKKSKKK